MGQARDEAGNVWEVDAQGNPVRLVQQAGAAAGSPQVTAIGSPDRYKANNDRRAESSLGLDAARLGISQQQLQLQIDAQRRASEEDRRKLQTLDARGGVETTESERTAAFLAARVAGGIQDLSRVGKSSAPGLVEGTVGGTKLGNYAISEQRQRTIAAQNDILDAALTLGTGAAYTKEQLEGYRQSYFPQPGDGTETVADKQIRLQRLLDAAKVKAGAAAPQIDTALKTAGATMFAPPAATPEPAKPTSAPFSPDQQKLYDAFMAANPHATPDQLRTFAQHAGLPNVVNAEEIIAARDKGAGVRPASTATYEQSALGQGMSGVNEGIAGTLGLPVDTMTSAINLIPTGINAIANTHIPTIENPVLGSDWWKRRMSDGGAIFPENADGSGQFVRRVGQSVGGALIPVAGSATTLPRAAAGVASALGGGVGAATAKEVFPGNSLAEAGGDFIGSGLTGLGALSAARKGARAAAEAAVPTIDQLKVKASDLYRKAESRGVVAGPNVTTNLAGKIKQIARDQEIITPEDRTLPGYEKANRVVDLLSDYSGKDMNARQIESVRRTIADSVHGSEGNERRVSADMLRAFDEETSPLAPEFSSARRTASRYLQAEEIGQARELADPRAAQYSQSGKDNALRTEFRRLDRGDIKGTENFHPDVVKAIHAVDRGTPTVNALRFVGRFAPTTGFASVPGLSIGGLATAVGGPPAGAMATGGTWAAGSVARALAERATVRNAEVAELVARNGGEIASSPVMDSDLNKQIVAQLLAQSAPYIN